MIKSKKQAKLKKIEDLEELEGIKKELFEEVKKQLPEVVKEKKHQLALELAKKGALDYAKIYSLVSMNNDFVVKKSYSNDEIRFALQQFQELVNMIIEEQAFIPTKNLFCSFMGISTATYDSWLRSNDEQRREVVQMVDDYIADVMLNNAQMRKIDGFTTVYRTKSQHGIIEKTAPIIVEHRAGADLDEIQNRINMLTNGKSKVVLDADYKEKEKGK